MAIVQTLGVASCLGGPIRSCGYAAEMLHDEFLRQKTEQPGLQLQWHMVYPGNHRSKQKKLAKLNQSISRFTHYWTEQNHTFLVIGGDHSCALGTWGGVLNGLRSPDQLGLIWLDAHMEHRNLNDYKGKVAANRSRRRSLSFNSLPTKRAR